ncbi:MAG TPA: glycogen debranching protein, partial [Phycisphaerales bacterium]|nr:glycogen debranching protein [Phycisphaerales bacterium]
SGLCTVTRNLHLYERRNAVALIYRIETPGPVRLTLRPLTALRDFHELLRGDEIASRYQARPVADGVMCVTRHAGVHIASRTGRYRHDPDIWHDAEYVWDARRGQESTEDLFSPGEFVFERTEDAPGELSAVLHASIDAMPPGPVEWDRAERVERVGRHISHALSRAPDADPRTRDRLARLVSAADDFVVQRGPQEKGHRSVIAGYPWFTDWGRDTMISLPGLMLAAGRFDEALATLSVFAEHRRRGLIPNRFDDRDGPAHYNTVDAPLWFLHAAAEYRRITGDHAGYMDKLAPACTDIIDAYRVGTDYNIRMDTDALITAGDEDTQLTWMDARRDGVTFTPRHGKAVEINALWHHGLLATADAVEQDFHRRAGEMREIAEQSASSFRRAFVRPDGLGLFDRLEPGEDGSWNPVPEIRPNQIFAVSLPRSPLDAEQKRAVVAVVRDRLLTPMGLRTLDPADPGYIGRYEGNMFQRDRAYHNGTVWPWLIGPYADALLATGAPRAEVLTALEPLLGYFVCPGLGQLPEIFDGDDAPGAPRRADGCPAQAWSVAEVLRVLTSIHAHP